MGLGLLAAAWLVVAPSGWTIPTDDVEPLVRVVYWYEENDVAVTPEYLLTLNMAPGAEREIPVEVWMIDSGRTFCLHAYARATAPGLPRAYAEPVCFTFTPGAIVPVDVLGPE